MNICRLLVLLAALSPFVASAQTTSTTMPVKDGNAASRSFRADQNVDGSLATHTVPEVGGAAVSPSNQLPVTDSAAVTALGTAITSLGTIAGNTIRLGTYVNGSVALSTTSAQVFAATSRVRVKLLNNSGVGSSGGASIVIWCRWGATPTANGIGSFPIQPGGGIDDQNQGVNQSALNCIAESGTPALYAEQY